MPGTGVPGMGSALLRRTRREAESLQSVIGGVNYATVLESDFWAEYSPVGRFGSDSFRHDLAPKC